MYLKSDDEVWKQLQATVRVLETANEEMKSAAEEYQSVNEELQSAAKSGRPRRCSRSTRNCRPHHAFDLPLQEGMAMSVRTTDTNVTFKHGFILEAFDGIQQPPGTYRVVIDDEEIIGLSFLAYRRTATTLHTPALGSVGIKHQAFPTSSAELEMVLQKDARLSCNSSG